MAEERMLARMTKRLEKIQARVNKYNNDTIYKDVCSDQNLFNDEWFVFNEMQKKGFREENEELADEIEEIGFEIKQIIFKWLAKLKPKNDSKETPGMGEFLESQRKLLEQIVAMKTKTTDEIKLPRLDIPKFSGKDETLFPAFRNMFETSVHNKDIPTVHKFQHLKALLVDEAQKLIQHVDITEENYDDAWQRVVKRYDRKKLNAISYVKKFFDQANITRCTPKALHELHDVSDQILRGLKALNDPKAEQRDLWLIYILVGKLDDESKRAWAKETAAIDFPTLSQFFEFLCSRCDELEACASTSTAKPANYNRSKSMMTNTTTCKKCEGNHFVSNCEKFIQMPIVERREFVVQMRLCFNCMSANHQAGDCKSRRRCEKCNRKHHTLLHTVEKFKPEETRAICIPPEEPISKSSVNKACASVGEGRCSIDTVNSLLPTAVVLIKSKFGEWLTCRLLIDSGSESSIISDNFARKLNLKRNRASYVIRGISEGESVAKGIVDLFIKSRKSTSNHINVKALVMSEIPGLLPSQPKAWSIADQMFMEKFNTELADPNFNEPQPIDMILGAEQSFNILTGNKVSSGSFTAYDTSFGWVLTGTGESQNSQVNITQSCQMVCDLDETLKKFWELEEVNACNPYTNDESECERIFQETTKRDETGKFIVNIPFKNTSLRLGNSYKQAIQRYMNLEKRLTRDTDLKKAYSEVINEYIELGHMVELTMNESFIKETDSYYLPHHAVIKSSSETTKVRVVFDGSSKTSTGVSLNNTMLVGPTIQPTLWSTLLRFRMHKIAITADIEKMYRQVKLHEPHQQFQRVLWRNTIAEPVKRYKLTTVTFGLASSPFLAIRALHQLGQDSDNPELQKVILEDFYVDDLLTGVNSNEEAEKLKCELSEVLKSGGFELRKWRSNSQNMGEVSNEAKNLSEGDNGVKVLGLQWDPREDEFFFKINQFESRIPTKRIVLSEFSKIFDPLGWLSPSIVTVKILFQKLWTLKLNWDDRLPEDLHQQYLFLRDGLSKLQDIKIPRYLENNGRVEYHGFCDASKDAYAAVIYIRAEVNGKIITRIVTAKTKVAPLKIITNTRMELMGAYLLAKLYSEFKRLSKDPIVFYAWTDSTQVLAYLSDFPARWKTFVANRTAVIQENIPRQHWNYINTKDNPADSASRGIAPSQLCNLKLWWEGPEWLKNPQTDWPIQPIPENIDVVEHERITSVKAAVVSEHWLDILCARVSNFNQIIRVAAFMLRYRRNLRHKDDKKFGPLSSTEIKTASCEIFKSVQKLAFAEEITALLKNCEISKSSKILSLAPFMDEDGIMRVGGRLHNYVGPYNYKHPIIIPKGHAIAKRIITSIHLQNFHAGPSLTFHLTRQKFWIIGGRNLVRQSVKQCIICFRHRAKPKEQFMGDLPAVRINPARPFTNCGVDYAGPIQIATKKGRGARFVKGYIAIFICMVTKAIHIEAVTDLSSDCFITAFQRFSSRRGVPANMYSDRGTNFVGAKRKLDEISQLIYSSNYHDTIKSYMARHSIEWHFNPPLTPHYGGLWERAVQSVKSLLNKTTHNLHVTYEELATLLTQIEAILNSRPICRMSMDDDIDFEALTPAHFLIGDTLYSVPDQDVGNIPENRLLRHQIIQQRAQRFWKLFHSQYIHELQQREKWQYKLPNFKIGDVVIIKDDNQPPLKWTYGKIENVVPDTSGIVRKVQVRVRDSTYERHVNKLCRLPISCD